MAIWKKSSKKEKCFPPTDHPSTRAAAAPFVHGAEKNHATFSMYLISYAWIGLVWMDGMDGCLAG